MTVWNRGITEPNLHLRVGYRFGNLGGEDHK
jgi:hypothetical protein